MTDAAWPEPAALTPLGANEVQVWRASVSGLSPLLGRLRAVLDAEGRAGADRFLVEADRARHIVSHGLLRLLLAQYLSHDPAALRLAGGDHGKPRLVEPAGATVQFNLSHSGDLVLLALSDGPAVGIDVQCWLPLRLDGEIERTSERFLSVAERVELGALAPERRREAFFAIWSRKEAYLKARGESLAGGLDWFDVTATPSVSCLRADRRDPGAPGEWTLRGLPIDPVYSAAVAVHASAPRLRLATAGHRVLAHA